MQKAYQFMQETAAQKFKIYKLNYAFNLIIQKQTLK